MFSEWYTKQCKTPFHPFQRSRRKLDRPADGRLKTKNWKVFFPPKKWKFQKLYEIWSPDFFWDIFRKFPVYHLKRMAYIIDLVIAQDSKIFRSTIYKTVVSPSICLIWQTCPSGLRKSEPNILMAFWALIYDRELILEKVSQTLPLKQFLYVNVLGGTMAGVRSTLP